MSELPLPVDPKLQGDNEDMITISRKELEKYKQDLSEDMAGKVLINTLHILKMFNQINDSLVNLTAFVANLREGVFKDLNLPSKDQQQPS